MEEKEAPKKARSTSSVQAKKEESIQQAQDKQEEAPPVEDIAADDIPF